MNVSRFLLSLTICTAIMFSAGCHSQSIDQKKLFRLAEDTMRTQNINWLHIRSQGPINDLIVSGLSVAAPSRLSRELAAKFAKGKNQPVNIVVTGFSQTKNKITIMNALELNKNQKLPYLQFMYFGFEADREVIERKTSSLNARYYFKPLQTVLANKVD